jgi:phytanoyl-CoA hydroxylase
VTAHTDNTYLITNPLSTMGVWIAIEDATKENGCMWGIPKSHETQTTKFFHRNQENTGTESTQTEWVQKICEESDQAVCLEASKGIYAYLGTVILLHGDFVHYSNDNVSGKSRHAYTMHFVEQENTVWDQKNWL